MADNESPHDNISKKNDSESPEKPLLEPLQLSVESRVTCAINYDEEDVCCPLCDLKFKLSTKPERDEILRHLILVHKLVIADVPLIADFVRYLKHWREKFKGKDLREYCSVIKTNTLDTDIAPSEEYYLLCDALPEDKDMRIKLQKDRLGDVLSQQQKERQNTEFSMDCLFCREHFEGNRSLLLNHMSHEHSFNIGQPDNLVYTDELLELLRSNLESLQCLYCEKTFKDRHVLKEHMRKKGHKRINPKNKTYDKFYIINYLEVGKNWEIIQSEEEPDDDNADDWGDWQEEGGATAVCLFCDYITPNATNLMEHMKVTHAFDLPQIKHRLSLNFYQQVKLINYIRRQIHQRVCVSCQQKFDSKGELVQHLNSTQHHTNIPGTKIWDQPQYFFPTYENDDLLCALDDDEEDQDQRIGRSAQSRGDNIVIAEDISVKESVLTDRTILEGLKK